MGNCGSVWKLLRKRCPDEEEEPVARANVFRPWLILNVDLTKMPFGFTITFGIFACITVLYLGFRHLPLILWLNARGAKARGLVVSEVVERGGRARPMYFPIVRFEDVRGEVHQFRSRFSAGRSLVGCDLLVAYDITKPDKRSEALRLKSIFPDILAAAFAVLVVASLTYGVIWASRVEKADHSQQPTTGAVH